MLTNIETYLLQKITPQRTRLFTDAIKLIEGYDVYGTTKNIEEVLNLVETYSAEEILGWIESIIDNVLQDILANLFVLTRGDLKQKMELLKGINILEHFIDSDVIVFEYKDELTPEEQLFHYLTLVTNKPVEYFDSFVIDVRPTLIERIVAHHQEQVDGDVENQDNKQDSEKLNEIRAFAKEHPSALGTKAVASGLIKVGMPLDMLLRIFTEDIYRLTSNKQIAEAIYSIVIVSDTNPMSTPKTTMQVVNLLYNEIELISELKYLVTSFN